MKITKFVRNIIKNISNFKQTIFSATAHSKTVKKNNMKTLKHFVLTILFINLFACNNKPEPNLELFSPEAFAFDIGESWEVNASVYAKGFGQIEKNDQSLIENTDYFIKKHAIENIKSKNNLIPPLPPQTNNLHPHFTAYIDPIIPPSSKSKKTYPTSQKNPLNIKKKAPKSPNTTASLPYCLCVFQY